MSFEVQKIGEHVLYRGDCLEVLASIQAGSVDLVTDPPYGIGADTGQANRANKQHGKAWAPSRDYGDSEWDNKPACEEVNAYRAVGKHQIIFGGNYFDLPPTRCWLVWDKLNGSNDYADCELAWTNLNKAVRRLQFRWHGMIRDEDGERFHPTQKPVGVMKWALSHLPQSVRPVCDPMMGSGTTGVACARTGRKFIGIEREPKYFDIACRRIEAELTRHPLLEPAAPIQRSFIAEAS